MYHWFEYLFTDHIDGLLQERRNSIANALELRLLCTNPLTSLRSLMRSHEILWDKQNVILEWASIHITILHTTTKIINIIWSNVTMISHWWCSLQSCLKTSSLFHCDPLLSYECNVSCFMSTDRSLYTLLSSIIVVYQHNRLAPKEIARRYFGFRFLLWMDWQTYLVHTSINISVKPLYYIGHINGLAQVWFTSIAQALELSQSCIKSSLSW